MNVLSVIGHHIHRWLRRYAQVVERFDEIRTSFDDHCNAAPVRMVEAREQPPTRAERLLVREAEAFLKARIR